jgi:hypothetical protein
VASVYSVVVGFARADLDHTYPRSTVHTMDRGRSLAL